MPLQIVEVADTGLSSAVGYAFPIATSNAVYWFPTSSGSILKYNVATDTVSTIATGVAHGWAGAIQGDDGLIYATPTNTHRTVLRLNPSTDSVATTTYSSSVAPFRLGVPSSVTVEGTRYIYAFPVGTTSDTLHRLYLKVNCSTFTATTFEPTSGTASANRLCGDSIAHPNGLIYLSPKDQSAFGYDVLILDPTDDTFTAVDTGNPTSAMVLRTFTTSSPIYLFGGAGIQKLTTTGTPSISSILSSGAGLYNSGDGDSGRRPALLLSTGNIIAVPTSANNARLVNTGADTQTSVTLSNQTWRSGGVIGGNGKGYWFDSSDAQSLEYDPATGAVAYINPDTADARVWGEPANVGGNVYVLSGGTGGFTRRVGVIEVAPPALGSGIFIDGAVHLAG